MAYLLEFLPSTLPEDIRAPPYVIFGIKGHSVVESLPSRIPLNAVLHFAPKLAQWLLPVPKSLPPAATQVNLHTPFVGIDIHLDIGIASLQRIIFKIVQAAGFPVPKKLFFYPPSLFTSISIRKTWLLLELPCAGLDGLHMHMQTRLMAGPPVTFAEMKELWDNFPANSDMLHLMAINFVQSHMALCYGREEFSTIRDWCRSSKERWEVFKAAEDRFPDFESRRKAREKIEAGDEEADQQALVEKMHALAKRSRKRNMGDLKYTKDDRANHKEWKSALNLQDGAEVKAMSAFLWDALRKVQLKRESEDVVVGETEDMLQPTVYNGSTTTT